MQRTILVIGQPTPTVDAIHAMLTDCQCGLAITAVPTVSAAMKLLDEQVALVLLHPDAGSVAKLREENAYLPIIMLADESHATAIIKGLQLGANDVLTPPLDAHLAFARMDAQLRLREQLEARDAEIDRLRREKAAQDRLVRMVTHDIKHPMGNIRMAEGLLRRYLSEHGHGVYLMDSVLSALDSMQETLQDFNDAFHLKEGMRLDVEPISLMRVINDSSLGHLAAATTKDMILDVDADDITVLADHGRLRRVVDNLISNAIKYSPAQSTINVRLDQNDDMVRITVRDQGPGIPADEAHLLFTEFGKLSTQPTGEESSTGLGLWIVKMMVEAMGGEVGAGNASDGGAIFWVDLPVAHSVEIDTQTTQDAEILVNLEAS